MIPNSKKKLKLKEAQKWGANEGVNPFINGLISKKMYLNMILVVLFDNSICIEVILILQRLATLSRPFNITWPSPILLEVIH